MASADAVYRVAVIGASGSTGSHVVGAFCGAGHQVTAVGRDAARLARVDPRARRVALDVTDRAALAALLRDVDLAIGLIPPWEVRNLLAAVAETGPRLVVGNSVRRYSRLTDIRAESARDAAAAFRAWPGRGIMLTFAMIYGHPGDRNINQILRWLSRWPAAVPAPVPLPDGGRARLQPLFIDDMVAAVMAAARRPELDGRDIDVAGGEVLSYAAIVRACAQAVGRRVAIASLPAQPMIAICDAIERWGLRLPLNGGQLRRATEDKIVDLAPLRASLGIEPIGFGEGLRRKRERNWFAGL